MRIGIMTFHASYNFGSVWQAFALQHILNSMGYDNEIINYRMLSQKDKYSLFPCLATWKGQLRNLFMIRFLNGKRKANLAYESFINNKLRLSEEINKVIDLNKIADRYDIFLSGSDQIWGYDVPEFVSSEEDSRSPYFLNFTDRYKISYASSTGVSSREQLFIQKDNLDKYSFIAVRESKGKEILETIVSQPIHVVLDPTYLISHTQWINLADRVTMNIPSDYVLIYSLQGMKKRKCWMKLIHELRSRYPRVMIISVSPFVPIIGRDIINMAGVGPEQILHLFAHAKYIYTDTFHGMSFSIHFRKNFSLFESKAADCRKVDVLNKFNLIDRLSLNVFQSVDLFDIPIHYNEVESKIISQINSSINYLKTAIEEFYSKQQA